jgi:copper oxidase (laccase) domain-containing protein
MTVAVVETTPIVTGATGDDAVAAAHAGWSA